MKDIQITSWNGVSTVSKGDVSEVEHVSSPNE